MKHRFLSMVLVLCMVVGLLPSTMLQTEAKANVATTVVNDGGTGDGSSSTTTTTDNSTLSETAEIAQETLAIGAATSFARGTGDADDPYIISNSPELVYFCNQVLGGNTFRYDHIMIDENAGVLELDRPIGKWNTTDPKPFAGTFDGNYKTIKPSTDFNPDGVDDLGIFGYNTGTIKNLTVGLGSETISLGTTTRSTSSLTYYIGGVVAYNSGKIINCENKMNVTANAYTSASRASTTSDSSYRNDSNDTCYTTDTLHTFANATIYAGGIVGYNTYEGILINCSNTGTITAAGNVYSASEEYTAIGSAVTDSSAATRQSRNTYSSGGIARVYAGGLVGINLYNSTEKLSGKIINSYNQGKVDVDVTNSPVKFAATNNTITTSPTSSTALNKIGYTVGYSGGIVGLHGTTSSVVPVTANHTVGAAANIINCYNSGAAELTATGVNYNDTVNTPYEENTIDESEFSGGVVGAGNITSCYWLSSTSGADRATGEGTSSGSESFNGSGNLYPRATTLLEELQKWVDGENSEPAYKQYVGTGYYDLYQWDNQTFPTFAYRINEVKTLNGNATSENPGTITFVAESTNYPFTAEVGDKITVTIDPTMNGNDKGYGVLGVYLSPANNTTDPLSGFVTEATKTNNEYVYEFDMPEGSVVVTVDFEKLGVHNDPEFGDHNCETDHKDWIGISASSELSLLENGGNYYIQGNTNMTLEALSTITIKGSIPTHLCLNGCTLEATHVNPVFAVEEGSTLTIHDGTANAGKITHTSASNSGATGVLINDGEFFMQGGQITGNNIGVSAASGSFVMSGGKIDANTRNVDVNKASMTVYGDPTVTSNGVGVTFTNDSDTIIYGYTTYDDEGIPTNEGMTGGGIHINRGADSELVTSVLKPSSFPTVITRDDNNNVNGSIIGSEKYFTANGAGVYYRQGFGSYYSSKWEPKFEDFLVYLIEDFVDYPTIKTKSTQKGDLHYVEMFYTGEKSEILLVDTMTEVEYLSSTSGSDIKFKVDSGGDGKDFFGAPTAAGTYDIIYSVGSGNPYYTVGEHVIGQLVIHQKPLTSEIHYEVETIPNQPYTGNAIKPAVTVNLLIEDGRTLELGKDYTVVYHESPINVGDYVVKITGCGNYSFYHEEAYKIEREDIELVLTNRSEIDNSTVSYGNNIIPTVKPALDNVILEDTDIVSYTVSMWKVDGTTETQLTGTDWTMDKGIYTVTYKTIAQYLEIGTHTLRVKFVADNTTSGNVFNASTEFTVTLKEKALQAAIPANLSREYNGNALFSVSSLLLGKVGTTSTSVTDTTKYVEAGDSVFASAEGFVPSANVNAEYDLTITDTALTGADARFYTLDPSNVLVDHKVAITAKNLNDADVSNKIIVEVMKGQGTFTTPEVTYVVSEEVVAIPGVMTYTTEGFTTHAEIEAHLKTLDVNGVLSVAFKFYPDNADNFKQEFITGTITFKVVDIMFSGIEEAIVIPDAPIYGNANNFFYDPSKFVAQVGTDKTTTGAYFLAVSDSLGATVDDLSIMKVGTYNYAVTFSSYDSAYNNVSVVKGSFTIGKRPVEYTWDSQTFAYDSTEKAPTATITNVVWVDEVSIAVTGAQINVGSYTGTLALAGTDKNNYELANETVTFSIEPSITKGIVTVSTADNDSSNTLSPGDVLTADVSAISPAGGTVFYHWYRNDVLMSSATWPTYTLSASDTDGTTIRCTVSFSGNTTGEISSTTMVVGNTFFTGSVLITHSNGVLTATVTGTNTDNYTIYWTGVNASATGETYTMNVADYGNNVSATVIATETSGYSGSISSSISVAAIKPDVPEITVTPGNTTAAVQWESIFHGGSALKDFKLSVTNESGKNITGSPFSLASTLTSFTVTGLTNGHVYCFQLTAENGVGESTSVAVYATPGETDTDTDTNGDVTTTTTTTVYTDSSGATVTKTVTIEANTTTGEVKTTTITESEGEDGTIISETATETLGQSGEVLETTHEYILESTDMIIKANVVDGEDGSEGTLIVETETSDSISLLANMVQKVADKDVSTITLITPNADITFDNDALDAIFASGTITSTSTIEIVAELTSSLVLPNHVQDRLQTAFIVDLTLKLNGKPVSDFGDGVATVKLPYTRNDTSKATSVYHVADSGTMTRLSDAAYVNSEKVVTFSTSHFSYYAVLEESSIFTDVKADDWYYNAVLWAVEEDITSGTTTTTFSPGVDCTRSQAMALLWKAMGKEIAHITIPFEDLSATDYFYEAVRWAYNRGITDGTSPKRFSPDQECTRSQIITFLWIANGKPIVDAELYFSDVATGIWYEEAVRWAVSEGITGGTNSAGTRFSPDQVCTRAEIVTFLYSNMHL